MFEVFSRMVEDHQDGRLLAHAVWAVFSEEGKAKALQAVSVLKQHGMRALAQVLDNNLRHLY